MDIPYRPEDLEEMFLDFVPFRVLNSGMVISEVTSYIDGFIENTPKLVAFKERILGKKL